MNNREEERRKRHEKIIKVIVRDAPNPARQQDRPCFVVLLVSFFFYTVLISFYLLLSLMSLPLLHVAFCLLMSDVSFYCAAAKFPIQDN